MGNVTVVGKRAEDIAEEFDWVISRAVKVADIGLTVGRMSSRIALLTTAEAPDRIPGFVWEAAIRLPWGDRRCLRIGQAVEAVSRETSGQ